MDQQYDTLFKLQMIQEFILFSHRNTQFVFSPLEGAAELLPQKNKQTKKENLQSNKTPSVGARKVLSSQ